MVQQEGRQPPQHQNVQPGHQDAMTPQPSLERPEYRGSGKLRDKVALGIGRRPLTSPAPSINL